MRRRRAAASAARANWARVSAVAPDFETARNRVRERSRPASVAAKLRASRLSQTTGAWRGGARAQIARAPRLAPPAPSSSSESKLLRRSETRASRAGISSSRPGRASHDCAPSSRARRNSSSAGRQRASAASNAASHAGGAAARHGAISCSIAGATPDRVRAAILSHVRPPRMSGADLTPIFAFCHRGGVFVGRPLSARRPA